MNSLLTNPAVWSRIQFAFTITYHYLFPQLTMGLAWFLVYWKWRALRTGDEKYNQAARFWAKIFGLNFAVGVVTGIPMEFQFGTNWAGFSKYAGGIRGDRAGFRVGNAARNACIHRFAPAALRPAGHPRGGDFSRRFAFDTSARKLNHR